MADAVSRAAEALTGGARDALSFQSYGRPAEIEGVWLRPLKKHRSENGWFAELLRLDGGAVEEADGFQARQVSAAHASPGRMNAFHIHPRRLQNELWTVLEGQLLVWLVDCRADSPTSGARRRVILSGEEPARLRIPGGVAHGYQAGPQGALLLYVMDQQFDAGDPDEGRLPWDHFGAELWEEDRG